MHGSGKIKVLPDLVQTFSVFFFPLIMVITSEIVIRRKTPWAKVTALEYNKLGVQTLLSHWSATEICDSQFPGMVIW